MLNLRFVLLLCLIAAAPFAAQDRPVTIRVGMLLDGKAVPTNFAMFRKAVATPGLKIVMGTDAVAGAHGRNADELVARVKEGGRKAMDAIVSATSLSAKS